MVSKTNVEDKVICIVGLGYVGLPLAEEFSKHFRVIGFDVNEKKIKRLI
jgi:UDP-N-acetyl-D-galactosamine dehydrogenase